MFETLLRMSASGPLESDGRLRSLPLSLALHGVAIGAVALFSARTLTESREPPVPVVFLEGSAPALPRGDGLPPVPREPAAEQRASAVSLTQPEETSSPRQEAQPAPTEGPPQQTETTTHGTAGDRRGRDDGFPWGAPDSEGRDGTRVGDSQKPFRIGGNVAEPRLLARVEPVYPEWARKAHIEGVMLLEAIIGTSGNVEELHVVKSVHALLDAAVVQAVQQWRYRPATLNGRPVRVYLTVTVEFKLR